MVEIKLESQEILFRVLYVGCEKSTKFATLRSLQETLRQDEQLQVLHAGGDRIIGLRHRLPPDHDLFGMTVAVTALAIPGTLQCPANEALLLRAADAIVWLDDGAAIAEGHTGAERLRSKLERLAETGRRPEELPLFVQGRTETLGPRVKDYRRLSGGWRPIVRAMGEAPDEPTRIFEEVERAILANYRRWEKDLEKRGLDNHIRVRDRIYEKVCLTPSSAADPAASDVRLFAGPMARNLEPSRWIFLGILLAAIAAACVLSLVL